MDEASNTHSFQLKKKPRVGFDLPNISFNLGPTKDCDITCIEWHCGHIGTYQLLGHGNYP